MALFKHKVNEAIMTRIKKKTNLIRKTSVSDINMHYQKKRMPLIILCD